MGIFRQLVFTIGNVVRFLLEHAVLVNFADGVGYLHGSCRVVSSDRSEDYIVGICVTDFLNSYFCPGS